MIITEPQLNLFCTKKILVITLSIKIIKYSAIKNNANFVALYSILKPETSSDSPSEKSKGVRLSSAIALTSHKTKIGKKSIFEKLTLVLIWLNDK